MRVVSADEILGADCDVVSPCALGGILNAATLPRIAAGGLTVAVTTPTGERRQTRATYIGGATGRSQAALIAAATLFEALADGA